MAQELEIIAAIEAQQVLVSRHARERLTERQVTFDEICTSIIQASVIEDYPDDTPYPSCLICAELATVRYLHTVWAYDESQNLAILITVYSPDPNLWIDWRQRRS
ncbi:DUF4258 domain-containing protein [Microcoleus sp. herbarium7]|uniref:DUF4258 domain-containing protein n=1 Tax=Microcoleus sp. herbarium7 TaxID=3055435 RepID=UPI002FD2DAF1